MFHSFEDLFLDEIFASPRQKNPESRQSSSPVDKKKHMTKCLNCNTKYHTFSLHCCFCRKNYSKKNKHCCLCQRTYGDNLIHCDECHVIHELTQYHCCKCNFTSGGSTRHCDKCHVVVNYYDLSKHVCKK